MEEPGMPALDLSGARWHKSSRTTDTRAIIQGVAPTVSEAACPVSPRLCLSPSLRARS